MKHYSRYITFAGGMLAFFSFVLPWVEMLSGINLAILGFHPIIIFSLVFLGVIALCICLCLSASRIVRSVLAAIELFFFFILFIVIVDFIDFLDSANTFVTFAFITSLVVIGMSLLLNPQSRWHSFFKIFVLINAGIGLLCFLIVVFSLKLNLRIAGTLDSDIKYGAFLTAIGFLLSIFGISETPRNLENSGTENQ